MSSLDSSNKRAKDGLEKAERKSDINSMDDSYVGDSLDHNSEVSLFNTIYNSEVSSFYALKVFFTDFCSRHFKLQLLAATYKIC